MGETGALLLMDSPTSSSAPSTQLALDRRPARSPAAYGRFLADLLERDMLEVGAAFSQVAPFFVYKKDNALILIFDTRGSNMSFMDPD
eukprot:827536-Pyramimonas_sp.AAC.1